MSLPNAATSSAAVRTNLAYLLPICLVATLGGLLFGYDTGVISGAIEPLTARFHLSDLMKGWASGCVLVVWHLVPETKGRTLEQIERSWSR